MVSSAATTVAAHLKSLPKERSAVVSAVRDKNAGKKLDMGTSCLRFRSLDDLPLDVIGEIISRVPPDAYIARYEAVKGIREKA